MNYPYIKSLRESKSPPPYPVSGPSFLSKVREFLQREERLQETIPWEIVKLSLGSYKKGRVVSWKDLKRVLGMNLRMNTLVSPEEVNDFEISHIAKKSREMKKARAYLEQLIETKKDNKDPELGTIHPSWIGVNLWTALLDKRLSPVARQELFRLCVSMGIISIEESNYLGKFSCGHREYFRVICKIILREEGSLKGMLSIADVLAKNPKKGWMESLYSFKDLSKIVGRSIESNSGIIYKRGWVILGEVKTKENWKSSIENINEGVLVGPTERVYADNKGDWSITGQEALLEEYKKQLNSIISLYRGKHREGPGYVKKSNPNRKSLRDASIEDIYGALRLYRRSQGQNTQVCLRLAQEKGYLKSWIQLLYVIGKEDINKGRNHIFFAVAMTQSLEGKYLRMGMKALKEARDQGIEEAGVRYDILRRQALGGSQRLKGIFG